MLLSHTFYSNTTPDYVFKMHLSVEVLHADRYHIKQFTYLKICRRQGGRGILRCVGAMRHEVVKSSGRIDFGWPLGLMLKNNYSNNRDVWVPYRLKKSAKSD